ncbi:MAG: ABC transporter substrate-binding protein [Defluviitaleaceae bacterium]|nr:ABC transporter substrate-binding protein [Defluviitaleaceae bacterium]
MKKVLVIATLILAVFALNACGGAYEATPVIADDSSASAAQATPAPNPTTSPDAAVTEAPQERPRDFVTITDFNGNVVQVRQNPSVVAVYDWGVLDMMYTVGFDKFGIETLIIPNPAGIPSVLSGVNNLPDVQIVNGGTLFYVNWDVLDLVPPELIILGARSFGMNAQEERLSAEDNAAFRAATEERYADTAFIRLTINAQSSDLVNDMRNNAYALSQIWPHVADYLLVEFYEIEAGMAAVNAAASASGLTTAFLMMTTPTNLSLFLDGSRMGMVFDEFGFTPATTTEDIGLFSDQHGFESRAEFILALNPDIILLLDRNEMADNVPQSAGFDALMSDPIIARTAAFENNRIYALYPQEWYTVVGGFGSARQMISCMMRVVGDFD